MRTILFAGHRLNAGDRPVPRFACATLHIPTQLYLPMQQDAFVLASVAPAGREWVRRFLALVAPVPVVLRGDDAATAGASDEDAPNVWELNNRWLLDQALSDGAHNLTVLVLWDGQMGDGPAGTGHRVHAAEQAGARSWSSTRMPSGHPRETATIVGAV